jgi:hypothetical protein
MNLENDLPIQFIQALQKEAFNKSMDNDHVCYPFAYGWSMTGVLILLRELNLSKKQLAILNQAINKFDLSTTAND